MERINIKCFFNSFFWAIYPKNLVTSKAISWWLPHPRGYWSSVYIFVSNRLIKNKARAIPELFKQFQEPYTQIPVTFALRRYVWRKSFDGRSHEEVHDHFDQHQFKIKQGKSDSVEIIYKKWSTSKQWLPTGCPTKILSLTIPNRP